MTTSSGFQSWAKIPLTQHSAHNGTLTVLADQGKPFLAQRAFSVQGGNDDLRGQHAHRTCSQLLVCLAGEIEVNLQNAVGSLTTTLLPGQFALFVPPMTWGSQKFLGEASLLLVLADGDYDEYEYIRDRDEFVNLISGSTGSCRAPFSEYRER